jgi:hypothetical protein
LFDPKLQSHPAKSGTNSWTIDKTLFEYLRKAKICDISWINQKFDAFQNLGYLATILNIKCYHYVAIGLAYMQLRWRFSDKPECQAHHAILYMLLTGDSLPQPMIGQNGNFFKVLFVTGCA